MIDLINMYWNWVGMAMGAGGVASALLIRRHYKQVFRDKHNRAIRLRRKFWLALGVSVSIMLGALWHLVRGN